MALGTQLLARGALGRQTATAGTKIILTVPPKNGMKTVIEQVIVTAAATAHTLTVLRCMGQALVTVAGAAGANAFTIGSDPGATMTGPAGPAGGVLNGIAATTKSQLADNLIAAGDFYVVELPDGTFFQDLVSSVTTLAITPTANLPTNGVPVGARVWWFGVETDKNPKDPNALAHAILTVPASATTQRIAADAGLFESFGKYEPILLIDNNATNAGTVELVTFGYLKT